MFKKQIIFLISVVTVVSFLTGCSADITNETSTEENKKIEIEESAAVDDVMKISPNEFDVIFYNNAANGNYFLSVGEKVYYYSAGYSLAFHDEEVYISYINKRGNSVRKGKLSDLINADSEESFYNDNTDAVTEVEDIISNIENQQIEDLLIVEDKIYILIKEYEEYGEAFYMYYADIERLDFKLLFTSYEDYQSVKWVWTPSGMFYTEESRDYDNVTFYLKKVDNEGNIETIYSEHGYAAKDLCVNSQYAFYRVENAIYRYSFDTGKEEKIVDYAQDLFIVDEEYIYIERNDEVIKLSFNGEEECILPKEEWPESAEGIFFKGFYKQKMYLAFEFEKEKNSGGGRTMQFIDFVFNIEDRSLAEMEKTNMVE